VVHPTVNLTLLDPAKYSPMSEREMEALGVSRVRCAVHNGGVVRVSV
jgi:hypothetical protein